MHGVTTNTRAAVRVGFMVAAALFGLAASANATPFTFNDLNPQVIGSATSTGTYPFELTNNTGVPWTDFHFTIGAANPPLVALFSNYTGPGTGYLLQDGSGNATIFDITGLNIPQGGTYNLSLDVTTVEAIGVIAGRPNFTTLVPGEAYYSVGGAMGSGSDVPKFAFSTDAVAVGDPMEFRTYGHSGGTNAAGMSVGAGGFDPLLKFRVGSTGTVYMAEDDDDGSGLDAYIPRAELGNPNPGDGLPAEIYVLEMEAYNQTFGGQTSAWAVDLIGPGGANMDLFDLYGNTGDVITYTDLHFGTRNGVGPVGKARVQLAAGRTLSVTNLTVGKTGNAVLDLKGGASLTSGLTHLAADAGSTAEATVSNATWQTGLQTLVGIEGDATLDVNADGLLQSNNIMGGNLFLGVLAAGSGRVTVDGSNARVSNMANIYVGGDGASAGGTGELTVRNGGEVTAGLLKLWGGATVNVQASGTLAVGTWEAAAGHTLEANWTGGTIEVSGMRILLDSANPDPVLGDSVTVGAGMKLVNSFFDAFSSSLTVGNFANGTMNVEGGGVVESHRGYIGLAGSSSGSVVVRNMGSKWVMANELRVGGQNTAYGELMVEDQGYVEADIVFIGGFDDATGFVRVIDAGSKLKATNFLSVAGHTMAGGIGELRVENGGVVESANAVNIWDRGTLLLDGGTVNVGTALLTRGSAILKGNGVINGTADHGGTVQPGTSAGLLTVNGNWVSRSTSRIEIELDGVGPANHDRIVVSGSAFLANALQIVQDTVPTLGDEFVVFEAGSLGGLFNQTLITGTGLTDPQTAIAVLYEDGPDGDTLLDRVRLMATYRGDADGNGGVSLADLDALGRGFGAANARWQRGDFNYDGAVSLVDLDYIGQNFGRSITAAPAQPAVPEPASLVLLGVGLLALSRRAAG